MQAILVQLAEKLLESLLGRFVDWARGLIERKKIEHGIDDDAERAAKKLKDAQTAQEVDDAADDQLNHL